MTEFESRQNKEDRISYVGRGYVIYTERSGEKYFVYERTTGSPYRRK